MPKARAIINLRRIVCQASAFLLIGSAVSAQERVVLTADPSCPECKISITPVARLGSISDPGSPMILSRVARDRRGRYYVGPTTNQGELFVYDADGDFIRSIGREGHGPGEFERIQTLKIGSGDTLYVIGDSRQTVISPTYELVRTNPLPGGWPYDAIVLGHGRTIVQTHEPSRELVGYMAHLVDDEGEVVQSFGDAGKPYRRGQIPDVRPIAYSDETHFWIGDINQYQIGLWNLNGRLTKTVVRSPSWFEPWEQVGSMPFTDAPPQSMLISVNQDSNERLWLVFRVPDDEWKRAASNEDREAFMRSRAHLERYVDTRIEVVDLREGRIIVSAIDDGSPMHLMGNGLAYRFAQNDSGNACMEVLRVQLIRP